MQLPDTLLCKKIYGVSSTAQVWIITVLYVLTILLCRYEYTLTGKAFQWYPRQITLFLAPLFEEIIFRGILQDLLIKHTSPLIGIIQSSLLFGIWHLKNIVWLPQSALIEQMLYAGFVIGPVLGYLAYRTKTIWPGVIIHYCANLIAGIMILMAL